MADAGETDKRTQAFVLGATILASSMAFIDGTVINVALPAIQKALQADFAQVQWVVNGYALMLGALILVAGGLGDRLGRRRVFVAGIGFFTLASIACALAPNVAVLIGARILQGTGAALLVPQSLAIITATFPRATRGRAIGTWAAASAATTAFGPALGGFLIERLAWPAAFWINIPIAAIALWLTLTSVPESRDEGHSGRLDWVGAAAAVLGFGALTVGLTAFSDGIDVGLGAYAAIAAGLVLIAAFVVIERRVAAPIVPPDLFRSRVFTGANIVTVFLYGCLAAFMFLLPFEMIVRRSMSAAEAGASLSPFAIIIAVASRVTGALSDRTGPRSFLIAGTALVAVGCAGFAIGSDDYWLGIMVPLVIASFGMALVVSPLTTAVMNAAPEGRSGAASGVNNAASRIAGLLAVAVFGALASVIFLSEGGAAADRFGILPEAGDPARPLLEAAFDSAYRAAMAFAAVWALLATLSVIVFVRDERSRP